MSRVPTHALLQWMRRQPQHPPEADRETRNRKRLQPNSLAEWELRVGRFRVFYDVDPSAREVLIVAIGYKQGSKLFVRGREHTL